MVRLAATFIRPARSVRSEVIPASSSAAASEHPRAHCTISRPPGVSREPRGPRVSSGTPTRTSIARTRWDSACWVTPSSAAASRRLPVRATTESICSEASSAPWD